MVGETAERVRLIRQLTTFRDFKPPDLFRSFKYRIHAVNSRIHADSSVAVIAHFSDSIETAELIERERRTFPGGTGAEADGHMESGWGGDKLSLPFFFVLNK